MTSVPAPRRSQASRLFGYDIFVSFALGGPPRGSRSYASDLARKLRERDFTVFFSEDEAPAGNQLDDTLKRALHRSRILVVIANRGTLADPRWVREEVEEFRRRHPARPIVPISIDRALQDPALAEAVQPWLAFRDKIWIDDSAEAGDSGVVSDAVVERLATAPTAVQSAARWRQLLVGLAVFFALLAGAAGWEAWRANVAREEALRQRNEAVRQRDAALARQLAVHAERAAPAELAALLAIESLRLHPFTETESLLREKVRLLPAAAPPTALEGIQPSSSVGIWSFSPRGRYFVASVTGGHLAVIEVASGRRVLRVDEGYAGRIAFSADESQLAVGNASRQVTLHRLPDGGSRTVLDGLGEIGALAFSPDGALLAVGLGTNYPFGRQRNGHVVLDTASGQSVAEARTGGRVSRVEFSPDGSSLAAQVGASVQLWRAADRFASPTTLHASAKHWAFDPVGGGLLVLDLDGALRSVGTSGPGWTLDDLHTFDLSSDGELLAAGRGNTVDLVGRDGKRQAQWVNEAGAAATLAFRGVRRRLVIHQTLFDVARQSPLVRIERGPVAWSPDGTLAATYEPDGDHAARVQFWHASGGHVLSRMAHEDSVCTVTFGNDSKTLLTTSADGTARLWSVPEGREQARMQHASVVTAAWFAPDGLSVVSAGAGEARWWQRSDGRLLATLRYEPEITEYFRAVTGCRSRPSTLSAGWREGEPLLAVAETGERAAVWRLRDGQRLSQVDHPADADALSNKDLLSVLLSRDASVLATANRSERAALLAWRPHDGALLQRFEGSSYGSRLAFDERGVLMVWPRRGPEGKPSTADSWDVDSGRRAPAGRPLVSSENLARSADGRRVAERQGRNVLVLGSEGPQRPSLLVDEAEANDIALSPDGRYVASAGGDGIARLFEASTDDLLADACRRLPRNLSGEQWARYVGTLPWHATCPGLAGAAPAALPASAPRR